MRGQGDRVGYTLDKGERMAGFLRFRVDKAVPSSIQQTSEWRSRRKEIHCRDRCCALCQVLLQDVGENINVVRPTG